MRESPYGAPFFYKGQQMNDKNVWLRTNEEKLQSLLADEAKNIPILNGIEQTIKQLKAKQQFRIALINQLIEEKYDKD